MLLWIGDMQEMEYISKVPELTGMIKWHRGKPWARCHAPSLRITHSLPHPCVPKGEYMVSQFLG